MSCNISPIRDTHISCPEYIEPIGASKLTGKLHFKEIKCKCIMISESHADFEHKMPIGTGTFTIVAKELDVKVGGTYLVSYGPNQDEISIEEIV